jgi:hypothetical protein
MKKKLMKKGKLYSINALNMHLKEIEKNLYKSTEILQMVMVHLKKSYNC